MTDYYKIHEEIIHDHFIDERHQCCVVRLHL